MVTVLGPAGIGWAGLTGAAGIECTGPATGLEWTGWELVTLAGLEMTGVAVVLDGLATGWATGLTGAGPAGLVTVGPAGLTEAVGPAVLTGAVGPACLTGAVGPDGLTVLGPVVWTGLGALVLVG